MPTSLSGDEVPDNETPVRRATRIAVRARSMASRALKQIYLLVDSSAAPQKWWPRWGSAFIAGAFVASVVLLTTVLALLRLR